MNQIYVDNDKEVSLGEVSSGTVFIWLRCSFFLFS